MRKTLGVVVALVATLGLLAPPVQAQAPAGAPAPKVTITGLVDSWTNWNKNTGQNATDRLRGSLVDDRDNEWWSHTRGRFDIIGELGKAKAVLGLELDGSYGITGATQSNLGKVVGSGFRPDGSAIYFGPDNDVTSGIEVKWMYVDAPVTGQGSLLPFIPWEGTLRMGGQPYALGLKQSLLADTDFGGWTYRATINPNTKLTVLFAQHEESSTGTLNGFFRGDDWGLITKLDLTPFKGFRVSPIFTYQDLAGTTNALIRRGTGGYAVGGANFAPDSTAAANTAFPVTNVATLGGRTTEEYRKTVGFDLNWESGPFYFAPTVFYQFGSRQRFESPGDPGAGAILRRRTAEMSAWILDMQGGYRLGPLLLEARALYTTGNRARDNLNKTINYYQPFQTGNYYWSDWGEISANGNIDYLTALNGFSNSLGLSANPSYDRYGRKQFAVKATYALTPALSVRGVATPMWTVEQVDTSQIITANGLAVPTGAGTTRPGYANARGDKSYLGTDLTAGLTWKFAPGLTFDWVYGYLLAGPAYNATVDVGTKSGGAATGVFKKFNAEDAQVMTARIRYVF